MLFLRKKNQSSYSRVLNKRRVWLSNIEKNLKKFQPIVKTRAVDRSTIQFWTFLTKGHST